MLATPLNHPDLLKRHGAQKAYRTLVRLCGSLRFKIGTEVQYAGTGTVRIKLQSTYR